jgi:hypothetical protein
MVKNKEFVPMSMKLHDFCLRNLFWPALILIQTVSKVSVHHDDVALTEYRREFPVEHGGHGQQS